MKLTTKLSFLNANSRLTSLFLLLFRTENYVTSNEISKMLAISVRTVKHDIKLLRQELAGTEIELISKPSRGYRLMFDQPDDRLAIKEYLEIHPTNYVETYFDRRVNYILRRLLSTENYITISQLKQELAVSLNISKEIKRVKEILNKYNLKLNSRSHYGMKIIGANFRKIMLTVRMYRYFDKNVAINFGIKSYNNCFLCSVTEKRQIRLTLFRTIKNYRVVFSDIDAERFIIYLLYFRNTQSNSLNLPNLKFCYRQTEEYQVVFELVDKLKSKFNGFDFSPEIIEFLTYIAILSTDLYRMADCTKENYGCLVDIAERNRNYILTEISEYLCINVFDDYDNLRDLLKIMIPISLKILLEVSDGIDLRYQDLNNNQNYQVLRFFLQKIFVDFYEKYHYEFSSKEQELILEVFVMMIERISLDPQKLRIAIIAIDGRLATQHLKITLLSHFSNHIEKITTKMLYELDSTNNSQYDLYLCSQYGKNLAIPNTPSPLYYIDETLDEVNYLNSLNKIFIEDFQYSKKLPNISLKSLTNNEYEILNEPELLQNHFKIYLRNNLCLYLNFKSTKENITVYKVCNKTKSKNIDFTVAISLAINGDFQKLKMIFNVINNLKINVDSLSTLEDGIISYSSLFFQR
ncbi:HTH domain-containing protein [Lactobacillus sp. ESL0677]|uniref:BglG family transcription antiterminator n=1 Tax=Lactobacillus sp. ESL0677 TaxID=2983208 RepID=UPI0023F97931|nr:HTH domain-containing protein [Lactobacillus sp. ESL0677]WEV37654.1 HTH domain-containing protein [Lactobacillus sp. ESL0677]